jgi:Tfp pilus assembly protein PilO
MTIAMERVLAWKLMPRLMMLVMTIMYIQVLHWFMELSPEAMTSQATALTATVTGAMSSSFMFWLGHEK